MKALRFILLITTGLTLTLPLMAQAQQSDGIFGCNETASYAMSVGSLRAVGGTFVPVSDNAVTLNTGYLAYKECTLRPAISAEVHAATAGISQAVLAKFTTGNNGNPYFPQNFQQDQQNVGNQAFTNSFYSVTNNVNSAFQQQVQTALARNYSQSVNSPSISIACPYTGNLAAVLNGTTNDIWGGISAMLNPACSPYSAYTLAQDQLNANVAAAQDAWQTQLNWGQGIYPVVDANGRVITPGILVGTEAKQAITSGFTQLQNANDIGQMTGALFASMGNQILGATGGGLAGITSSIAGQPSYSSQVSGEASQGLRQAVTNVALTILGPALAIEQSFNAAENAIAGTLTQSITQLRGAENTCWALITSKVCSDTPSFGGTAGPTCTGTNGATLHIATSTAFSQPIIDAQIAPLSQAVVTNVRNSNQALQTIQSLVTGVQNTSSGDVQQSALQQLDQLVAQGLLHNQNDLNTATQNQTDVSTAMQTLITNTAHQWAGDDTVNNVTGATAWDGSSATGWCNVNQQATVNLWLQAWNH